MYAMLCTIPDVNLSISLVGRYQSNPGKEHWTVVKNILKYLKRTKDMFLVYGGDEELVVKGYVDASFDTDPDDSKSQTGRIFPGFSARIFPANHTAGSDRSQTPFPASSDSYKLLRRIGNVPRF